MYCTLNSCNSDIDWMHCERSATEDPSSAAGAGTAGTWQQSWRALEKAYAEGRVMSIGVSNFDADLLSQMQMQVQPHDDGPSTLSSSSSFSSSFSASVLPHIVQNWAEPGSLDIDVRRWCQHLGAHYQPYAPLRNLQFLSVPLKKTLQQLARKYSTSVQVIALKLFLQTGALGIPRSTSREHLAENLKLAVENEYAWSLNDSELKSLGWNASE